MERSEGDLEGSEEDLEGSEGDWEGSGSDLNRARRRFGRVGGSGVFRITQNRYTDGIQGLWLTLILARGGSCFD